jgi:hypothetical protein
VLEVDQQRIDSLDLVVDLDEVLGEEAANDGEITLGHRGPKVLFQIYDFDGSGGLGRRRCGKKG